jgi:hypothetical protein
MIGSGAFSSSVLVVDNFLGEASAKLLTRVLFGLLTSEFAAVLGHV